MNIIKNPFYLVCGCLELHLILFPKNTILIELKLACFGVLVLYCLQNKNLVLYWEINKICLILFNIMRGSRRWFTVEAKSYEILVEGVGRRKRFLL